MSVHSYQTTAYNYAQDSDNKVHDDEVAARFGFEGGLVPGASDFAYLSHAVYGLWGDAWLRGGSMQAKFIKPIYHGERVTAEARSVGSQGVDDGNRLDLALLNAKGVACALGSAQRICGDPVPDIAEYPRREPLAGRELASPDPSGLPPGHLLGVFEFEHDESKTLAETRALFVETLDGSDGAARWHPALGLHYANTLVRENVRLGPWIHTASRVHYIDSPHQGELVSVRGRVIDTYNKRGHVVTDIDIGVFAAGQRPLAKILHTAIVRLAER